MLLNLVARVTIGTYDLLQMYAPSNRLLRTLRQQSDRYWALRISLYAIPYFVGACIVRLTIEAGGPGWLHIVFAILMWNTLKFLPYWPVYALKGRMARLRHALNRQTQMRR